MRKKKGITVGKLIKQLKKYPKDARVLLHGYEDNMDDCIGSTMKRVVLDDIGPESYNRAALGRVHGGQRRSSERRRVPEEQLLRRIRPRGSFFGGGGAKPFSPETFFPHALGKTP